MNKVKQLETIRKHNLELSHQLDEAKFELEYNSKLNAEGYQRAKDLIDDLYGIKKIMTDVGFKIPWYKKIINKLKSL